MASSRSLNIAEHIQTYLVRTEDGKTKCTLCDTFVRTRAHVLGRKHLAFCRANVVGQGTIFINSHSNQSSISSDQTVTSQNPPRHAPPASQAQPLEPAMTENPAELPKSNKKMWKDLSDEEKLNNLDRGIFVVGIRNLPVEILKMRRELIQKMGMEKWRAIEEKRAEAWKKYKQDNEARQAQNPNDPYNLNAPIIWVMWRNPNPTTEA